MAKKIKINQKNLNLYLIIVFLIIVFLIKIDFFKNAYFLISESYNQRMVRIYGDCNKDSYGFLKKIKNKYDLKENPKILNSDIIPTSDWIIFNPSLKFSNQPKIFLNYKKNPTLNFKMINDRFVSNNHVQFTDNLKSIIFKTKNEKINLNFKLKVFKEKNNKKEIIFEKSLKKPNNKNKIDNINFKTKKFNSRWEKFILELENYTLKEKKEIVSIILVFDNEYKFNETDIIFSRGNCYYIK